MIQQIRELMTVGNGFHRKDITSAQLIEMADLGLLKPFLYDSHNEAPSIEEFINLARLSDRFLFECYVTNVGRADERFSIEGFHGRGIEINIIADCISKYRFADELEFNNEFFRAWWD